MRFKAMGGPYKMRTVVRLTGFSAAVLRAWERRHGLLEPDRGPGGHRLYTALDMRVLQRVRVLVDAGRSIGEIASMGRVVLASGSLSHAASGAPDAQDQSGSPAGISSLVRRVVGAAVAINRGELIEVLDEAFAALAPSKVLSDVIAPASRDIGNLWAKGACSVAGEHLASALFCRRLHALLAATESGRVGLRPIICACFPGELHELPALMVAYEIARGGAAVEWLGASLPFEDLELACSALKPRAVCLSVSRKAVFANHRHELVALVTRLGGRSCINIGGAGCPRGDSELEAAGAVLWGRESALNELGTLQG